jgi:hypothetical protein
MVAIHSVPLPFGGKQPKFRPWKAHRKFHQDPFWGSVSHKHFSSNPNIDWSRIPSHPALYNYRVVYSKPFIQRNPKRKAYKRHKPSKTEKSAKDRHLAYLRNSNKINKSFDQYFKHAKKNRVPIEQILENTTYHVSNHHQARRHAGAFLPRNQETRHGMTDNHREQADFSSDEIRDYGPPQEPTQLNRGGNRTTNNGNGIPNRQTNNDDGIPSHPTYSNARERNDHNGHYRHNWRKRRWENNGHNPSHERRYPIISHHGSPITQTEQDDSIAYITARSIFRHIMAFTEQQKTPNVLENLYTTREHMGTTPETLRPPEQISANLPDQSYAMCSNTINDKNINNGIPGTQQPSSGRPKTSTIQELNEIIMEETGITIDNTLRTSTQDLSQAQTTLKISCRKL